MSEDRVCVWCGREAASGEQLCGYCLALSIVTDDVPDGAAEAMMNELDRRWIDDE